MAVSCVTKMSRMTPISASSAPLLDGCCSSSSAGPVSSSVRFTNGNAARFRSTTLSLSFKRDVFCGVVISQLRSNKFEVGFVKLGQFEGRKRWGAVASVGADATAVAESEEAETSSEKQLIGNLLSVVSTFKNTNLLPIWRKANALMLIICFVLYMRDRIVFTCMPSLGTKLTSGISDLAALELRESRWIFFLAGLVHKITLP